MHVGPESERSVTENNVLIIISKNNSTIIPLAPLPDLINSTYHHNTLSYCIQLLDFFNQILAKQPGKVLLSGNDDHVAFDKRLYRSKFNWECLFDFCLLAFLKP